MHLNKEKISTALGEYQDTIDIKIYEETASTNKLAKETEYSRNTLFIAQRQSAGRGRLGRSFISPDGGLYMSLALHTNIPMEKLQDHPMQIKSQFQQNRERKETKAAVALQRTLEKMKLQNKKK